MTYIPTPVADVCASKVPYSTRAEAKSQLKRWQRSHSSAGVDSAIEPYHCAHCGQWHLGHKRRPNAKRMRRRWIARWKERG